MKTDSHQQGEPRVHTPQAGNILVSVLMAMGAMGVVVASLTTMVSQRMNAQRHTEYNEELEQLRQVVSRRVACEKTIVKANCVASFDASGTLTPSDNYPLLDRAGAPLNSQKLGGHLALGRWAIRARCVKSGAMNTLQIATARYNVAGTAIAQSPLNKKPLGWMPLFDKNDSYRTRFCESEIMEEEGVVAKHIKEVPLKKSSKFCTSLTDMAKQGDIPLLYEADIQCTGGSKVLAGGIACGTGPKNFLTGAKRGTVLKNAKTSDTTWSVACCQSGILASGDPQPTGYAVCSNF